VVESAIVFGNARSSIISDGEADVLVGFEPLETLRAINKCNTETVVITNMAPLPPLTVATGMGVYPDLDELPDLIRARSKKLVTLNAANLAKEAGNIMALNMVLMGALIQSETLPITSAQIEEVIRTKTKAAFVDVNLKAFKLGYEAAVSAG
jgi:indolepyruvate ferredoxin oxidoreductase beta subunit